MTGHVPADLPPNTAFGQLKSRLATYACWGRTNYHAIFVAVFLVLLLLPLQSFPGNFSDFPKAFWGYEELLRGYTTVRYSAIKDLIFGDIFSRPGNWLVYTGETSLDDYQNAKPFTAAELTRIQQNLDGLDQRLREKGITFLVVIVPGKNTIYPEAMPPQIMKLGPQSRTDQLTAYMRQHGSAWILDLTPALQEARKAHQVYYATDTHWNQYGILAGYAEILGALKTNFPNLQPHSLADFRYVATGSGSGDLSREWVQGLAQEEMFKLEPRFNRHTAQITLTQGTALVPGRMVATYNPDPSLPRAVIYHDSFFNEMMPFLADDFSWAVFHWAFKVDENFIAGEKPNVVIFEVTDRYLSRLLDLTRK